MSIGKANFLDTSIIIHSLIECEDIKNKINSELKLVDANYFGSVVLSEFKKRYCKDLIYLLELFKIQDYDKVMRQIARLNSLQNGKFRISLSYLNTLREETSKEGKYNEEDLRERAISNITTFLRYGIEHLKRKYIFLDNLRCNGAREEIIEIRDSRFEYVFRGCNRNCGASAF